MVEVGQIGGQRVRIGAVQAGAAEHQVDLVVEDVGRDAAPQQLHGDTAAIGGIDTGAPELEYPTRKIHDRRDVVLVRRVEMAQFRRGLALDQPVGADHPLWAGADRMIDHQQMVGDRVEGIAVTVARGGGQIGLGTHLLIEHAVAQRLHGVDLRGRIGDPDAEIAGAQLRERKMVNACPGNQLFKRHRAALPCSMAGSGSRSDPAIRRERRCRASLSRVVCTDSRRRPNNSRRRETKSKPRRSAIVCISRS